MKFSAKKGLANVKTIDWVWQDYDQERERVISTCLSLSKDLLSVAYFNMLKSKLKGVNCARGSHTRLDFKVPANNQQPWSFSFFLLLLRDLSLIAHCLCFSNWLFPLFFPARIVYATGSTFFSLFFCSSYLNFYYFDRNERKGRRNSEKRHLQL